MSSEAASALDSIAKDEEHNVAEVAAMHNSTDLESRLRDMILSNAKPPPLPPHMQAASHSAQKEYQSKHLQVPPKSNTSSSKPSQAQRKQLQQQSKQQLLPTPTQTASQRSKWGPGNTTSCPLWQANGQKPVERVPRMLHALPPSLLHDPRTVRDLDLDNSRPRHSQSRGGAASNGSSQGQQNTASFFPGTSRHFQTGAITRAHNPISSQAPSVRPTPQSRQLFDPSVGGAHQNFRSRNVQPPGRSLRTQVMFLEELAMMEIRKAEISPRDLQEKEALRIKLEQISRAIVTAYEKSKQELFDEQSVSLKCYGSLSSGFATQSSDMDLAFVSPISVSSTTSTDSEIPRLLEKAFLEAGYGARLLTRTRIPILKFCEKPTPDLLEALRKNREKWEKSKDQPLHCYNCSEAGHLSHSCTAPKKPKSCFRCGESGHVARECNNLVLPRCANLPAHKLDETNKTNEMNAAQEMTTPPEKVADGQPTLNLVLTEQSYIPAPTETQQKVSLEDPSTSPKTDGHDSLISGETPEATEQTDIPESDKELVRLYRVAMDDGCYDDAERFIIRAYIDAVQLYGPNGTNRELLDARLHLGCFPDRLQHYRERLKLDFPRVGVGIQCDINFSNQLALHNTLMLRCYSHCDPRVRLMILAIKSWAKTRKINSPYHGTLSSYGYVLMVLHYLVNIARPPVTPNLQLCRKAFQDGPNSEGNKTLIDGYNVRFWRSESEIRECAAANQLTVNYELLGSLLRGFFEYFAMPVGGGFSWPYDVLSLRTPGGILSKKEKDWTAAKTIVVESNSPSQPPKEIRQRYLFAIEDPFELDHNIARTVVHHGIIAIRDEFRRAHAIIQGWQEGDLFAEAEDKVNLQKRPPHSAKSVDERVERNVSTGGNEAQAAEAVKIPTVPNPEPRKDIRAADHTQPHKHVQAANNTSAELNRVPKQANGVMPKPKNQRKPAVKKDASSTSDPKTVKLATDQKILNGRNGIATDMANKRIDGLTPVPVQSSATTGGEGFKADVSTLKATVQVVVGQPNLSKEPVTDKLRSTGEAVSHLMKGKTNSRNGEARGGSGRGRGRGRGRGGGPEQEPGRGRGL